MRIRKHIKCDSTLRCELGAIDGIDILVHAAEANQLVITIVIDRKPAAPEKRGAIVIAVLRRESTFACHQVDEIDCGTAIERLPAGIPNAAFHFTITIDSRATVVW